MSASIPPDVPSSANALERWGLCARIAQQITGAALGTPENVMFARAVYISDIPTTASPQDSRAPLDGV
jgi:hypothetical protein